MKIRNWRFESLKAIFGTEEFRHNQRIEIIFHCKPLYTALVYFLPALQAEPEGWKSLYEKILGSALQVPNNVHLFTVNYRILFRMSKPPDKLIIVFMHE